MKSVEDMLKDRKRDFDGIKAPIELEDRLRSALNNGSKRKRFRKMTAAVVILALTIGYSYDAVAYYGKKILGYDKVTLGSLGELNEIGRGQEINKSCTFSDGAEVELDGIFFDENKLVALLKFNGISQPSQRSLPDYKLKGLLEYNPSSGYGHIEEDGSMIFLQEFEPPAFFEKLMSFEISLNINKRIETKEIKFTLNRNKAMNQVVSQKIAQEIKVEGIPVQFDSISASPLSIEVKGSIDKQFMNENVFNPSSSVPILTKQIEFDLYVNDRKQVRQGGGMSQHSDEAADFHSGFDGILEKVKSMKIKNIRLIDSLMVDKSFNVDYNTKNMEVDFGTTSMTIKDISFDGQYTYVRLESEKNVEVPIGLLMNNSGLELLDTIFGEKDGLSETTYKFKGKGENMQMGIKVVNFVKKSDGNIDIPVK